MRIIPLKTTLSALTGLLIALSCSFPVGAETQENEAQALWTLMSQVHDQHQGVMRKNTQMENAHAVFEQGCDMPLPDTRGSDILHAAARDRGKRTGLSLRGGYTNRTVIDDDGESSAYVELDWDLLKNGYFENRDQVDALQLRAQLETLKERHQDVAAEGLCRRYNITRLFSGSRAALISLKLELMKQVNAIERRAYLKGWSQLDDALEAEGDMRALHSELNYLHGDADFDAFINTQINPPIIDLDIAALSAAIRADELPKSIAALELQDSRQRAQADHPNTFRLFVRQNLEVDNNGDNGAAVGFRFIVPIERRNYKTMEHSLRLDSLSDGARYALWERLERTRTVYEGLTEQKERTLTQQYRYMTAAERLRRTLAEQQLEGKVDPALAVIRLRALLASAIELIKAKEELYRRVSETFRAAHLPYDRAFVYQASIKEEGYRSRVGQRAIYIWSNAFQQTDNKTLIDILRTKGIERAIVSYGANLHTDKVKQFNALAEVEGITVETLLSSNEWIFPEKHQNASIRTAAAAEISGRVHLDIEPHTLPGYQDNKAVFLQHYLDMLTLLRESSKGYELSVAVPTHWPVEIYERIDQLADRVYIMSYESDDADLHVRRLSKLLPHLDASEIVVVQRIIDYEDEWALENSIEHIYESLNISQFGLHKLSDFIGGAHP